MYGCVCMCAPFVAPHHVACLVAAIWLHAIRVPPSTALALANMAGEERGGVWGEGGEMGEGGWEWWGGGGAVWSGSIYGEEGKRTEPQVNSSISLIPCDVHSLVKRDVQLDVKRNDSPSHMMQSDALSCQLT